MYEKHKDCEGHLPGVEAGKAEAREAAEEGGEPAVLLQAADPLCWRHHADLSNQHQQGQHLYSYCLVRLGDLMRPRALDWGRPSSWPSPTRSCGHGLDAGFEDLTSALCLLAPSCSSVPGLPGSYEVRPSPPLPNPQFLLARADLLSFAHPNKNYNNNETQGDLTEIKGYISLLAAVCQRQNPDWCWSYQARFLNHLPATERTALALDAFLQIAGHALHTKFRRQQDKVFACVRQGFVRSLGQAKGSEDVDAVKSRIEKYVDMRVFASAPKDSHIPETDESTHIRC